MVPFEMQRLYQPEASRRWCGSIPKQQVPVLIHGDVEIFDSTQIFEYFEHLQPHPALWPAEPAARARARLLELKSDEVYFPPIIRLMGLQDDAGRSALAVAAREAAARVLRRDGSAAARPPLPRPEPIPTPTSRSTWRSCSARAWARR